MSPKIYEARGSSTEGRTSGRSLKAVAEGRVKTQANLVLASAMANSRLTYDTSANAKLIKRAKGEGSLIDAVSALILAVGCSERYPVQEIAWAFAPGDGGDVVVM